MGRRCRSAPTVQPPAPLAFSATRLCRRRCIEMRGRPRRVALSHASTRIRNSSDAENRADEWRRADAGLEPVGRAARDVVVAGHQRRVRASAGPRWRPPKRPTTGRGPRALASATSGQTTSSVRRAGYPTGRTRRLRDVPGEPDAAETADAVPVVDPDEAIELFFEDAASRSEDRAPVDGPVGDEAPRGGSPRRSGPWRAATPDVRSR